MLPARWSSTAETPHPTLKMSKPTILILGDPVKTIRWRTSQFEQFASNFTIKVNQDLTYTSFETALRQKKCAPPRTALIQVWRLYRDYEAYG
jgi:hypothetical protein